MPMERRSLDEGGDGKNDKKMRTMVSQNLDLKEYVKNGTLFSARRTQQV